MNLIWRCCPQLRRNSRGKDVRYRQRTIRFTMAILLALKII